MQRPLAKYKLPLRKDTGHFFDPFRLLSTKSAKTKPTYQKKIQSNANDENINTCNLQQSLQKKERVLGLTKRIRKPSIIRKNPISIRSSEVSHEMKSPLQTYKITIQDKTFDCYPDSLLNIPQEFRGLNQQHKQDNDCDSDWDQVEAGAHKLFRSLRQRLLQRI